MEGRADTSRGRSRPRPSASPDPIDHRIGLLFQCPSDSPASCHVTQYSLPGSIILCPLRMRCIKDPGELRPWFQSMSIDTVKRISKVVI